MALKEAAAMSAEVNNHDPMSRTEVPIKPGRLVELKHCIQGVCFLHTAHEKQRVHAIISA
jgi:hypothetical protein